MHAWKSSEKEEVAGRMGAIIRDELERVVSQMRSKQIGTRYNGNAVNIVRKYNKFAVSRPKQKQYAIRSSLEKNTKEDQITSFFKERKITALFNSTSFFFAPVFHIISQSYHGFDLLRQYPFEEG